MFLILLFWTMLFGIFTGIGLFVLRFTHLRVQNAGTILECFWIGWIFTILLCQFWHMWLKIDGYALGIFSAIGVAGLVLSWKEVKSWASRQTFKKIWYLLPVILAIVWIANQATAVVSHWDSASYHLSAVKWAGSYPIVKGLGLLNTRLAFNSAFFLYSALVDIGPFEARSHHVSTGLLFIVLFIQVIWSYEKILSNKLAEKDRIYHLFNCLFLVPILWKISGLNYISSIAPDSIIFILGILISSQWLLLLTSSQSEEKSYRLCFIAAIAFTGIATKLTFVIFGATTFIAAFFVYAVRDRAETGMQIRRVMPWVLVVGILIIIPWMYRNTLLSGYPVFPLLLWDVAVEWKIPQYSINAVLLPWKGISGILELFNKQGYITDPLSPGLICFAFVFCFCLTHQKRWHCLFPAPAFLSILFWLYTIPLPRFAGATVWVFVLGVFVFILYQIGLLNIQRAKWPIVTLLGVYLLISFPNNFSWIPSPNDVRILQSWAKVSGVSTDLEVAAQVDSYRGLYPMQPPVYETMTTKSGLQVNVPIVSNDSRCWNNVPLPCTDTFDLNLRLIKHKDMSAGFLLEQ